VLKLLAWFGTKGWGIFLCHQQLPLVRSSCGKYRVYESCQLRNPSNYLFSEFSRISSDPLEIIHSDVWTSLVTSLSGCKFYVLLIDTYNRLTWLYPIMSKTHVYQCFIKFKLLVENLFSIKIKYHKFDNGGDYTSFQFKRFLSQHGILHKLTCSHIYLSTK
jgi:hypothetical protein